MGLFKSGSLKGLLNRSNSVEEKLNVRQVTAWSPQEENLLKTKGFSIPRTGVALLDTLWVVKGKDEAQKLKIWLYSGDNGQIKSGGDLSKLIKSF